MKNYRVYMHTDTLPRSGWKKETMALNYSEVTKQMSISLVSNEVSLLNSPRLGFSSFTTILYPDAKQNFHLLFNKYVSI